MVQRQQGDHAEEGIDNHAPRGNEGEQDQACPEDLAHHGAGLWRLQVQRTKFHRSRLQNYQAYRYLLHAQYYGSRRRRALTRIKSQK